MKNIIIEYTKRKYIFLGFVISLKILPIFFVYDEKYFFERNRAVE